MAEAPAVRAAGVWKGYGGRPVLRGLDLEVAWGEFLVLLGANGSGKTTLLKLLATLARPERGEVLVAGLSPMRHGARVRRLLGVVAHQPLLYDAMSVQENLAFYGRMYGVPALPQRIQEVVAQVGLTPRLRQRVGSLSHGMQQRLALARALLHDPPILLLDEPESGLDPEALAGLGRLLRGDGATGRRRTVVMTTHSVEQAAALADRVAVLAGGRIAHQEARAAFDGDAVGLRRTLTPYLAAP